MASLPLYIAVYTHAKNILLLISRIVKCILTHEVATWFYMYVAFLITPKKMIHFAYQTTWE